MRNKILIIIILVLSYFAVQIKPKEEINFFANSPEEKEKTKIEVKLLNQETQDIKTLDLEDYVIGVVAAEMPASFSLEALKAQAVASRTYALYKINNTQADYDLVTDVTNQAYITKDEMVTKWQSDFATYYEKVKQAVNDTEGEILTYDNEVICAFYFAMSNGYTEDASLVFGSSEAYIKSVDSTWDRNLKNFEVTTTFSKTEFCSKLNINCDQIKISDIIYSNTGRVNSLKINDQTFAGTKVRSLLNLRSTDFQITINDEVIITTKGYGHGVGMSQYGANEMAKNGSTYSDILKYYYQGVTLEKINV